jgi:hypothetical protein
MNKSERIIREMVAEIDPSSEVDDYSSLLSGQDAISVRIRRLNRTITVNIPSPMLKPIKNSAGEIRAILKEAVESIS